MNENPTDANEQFELGNKYRDGDGVPKDREKMYYWYTKAAEQKHLEAQIYVGMACVVGELSGGLEKAEYWLTKAAEQGDVKAQSVLGEVYDHQIGDKIKAMHWYTKAAEQGHAEAQFNLGSGYNNGDGVPEDLGKAVYWYTKAAEQGHALAQNNLGSLYHNGDGVPEDLEKAYYWYTKAAKQGVTLAKNNLRKIKMDHGFITLSVFFPYVGLILFLVWLRNKPRKAKSCGIGVLIFVILLFIACLPMILY